MEVQFHGQKALNKYLGIVMQSSRLFKCVFDSSKKSFYKSFNAIFGILSVTVHLE